MVLTTLPYVTAGSVVCIRISCNMSMILHVIVPSYITLFINGDMLKQPSALLFISITSFVRNIGRFPYGCGV